MRQPSLTGTKRNGNNSQENETLPYGVQETQPPGIHPSMVSGFRRTQSLQGRISNPIYDQPEGQAVEHWEEVEQPRRRIPEPTYNLQPERPAVEHRGHNEEREETEKATEEIEDQEEPEQCADANLGGDFCQPNCFPVMQDIGNEGSTKRSAPPSVAEDLQIADPSNVPGDVNCPGSMPPTGNDTDESISGDQLMAAGGSQTDGHHSSNNKKKKHRKKKKKNQRAMQAHAATSLDAEVASEDEPEASTDESHHNSSVAYASDTEQKLHEPGGEEGTREPSAALDSKEVGPKKE